MSYAVVCVLIGLICTGINYYVFPVKQNKKKKIFLNFVWNIAFLNSLSLFIFEFIMNRPNKVTDMFTVTPLISKQMFKYILITIFIYIIIIAFKVLFTYGPIKIKRISIKYNWKQKTIFTFFSALFMIMMLIALFCQYFIEHFDNSLPIETEWFNLAAPSIGASNNQITSLVYPVFNGQLLIFIVIILFLMMLIWSNWTVKIKNKIIFNSKIWKACIIVFAGLFIGAFTINMSIKNNVGGFIKATMENSSFIQKNYVNPDKVKMTYPKKKRNIVHIYLESMENSYMDKKSGGNMDQDLMPALKRLSREPDAVHFSNNDKEFGGPYQTPGSWWSMAGMINMTSGLPVQISSGSNYGANGYFLPGATILSDILHKQGYNQTFMVGSRGRFTGKMTYWLTHGYNKMYDFDYGLEHNKISKKASVMDWGIKDKKLYQLSKEEMSKLAAKNRPFNLTIENVNTHFPAGYVEPGRKQPYKQPYANAIFASQEDVVKLVRWIQSQPYGKNTTIVLTGDHLSMAHDFFNYYQFSPKYHRTPFNLILNGDFASSDIKTKNRQYAPFDYFPTIVESLGIRITGHRLGLGTDLTSNKKTLLEQFGVKKVYDELSKRSPFYQDNLMSPKHHKNRVMEPQDEYVKKRYSDLPSY